MASRLLSWPTYLPQYMRGGSLGVGQVPFIDIDHAVAAVDFHDGSDEGNDAIADFADVRAFVDGEAVSEFHERGGRTGFGRVNGAGDVVDGNGVGDEFVGFSIVEMDSARIGELSETLVILLEIFEIGFGGDGNGDHLAAFFGGADGENLHTGRGFFEKAHVLVDIFGVGKNAGRASDVAEDRFGSRNSFAGGKIVDERRGEVRLRGVLANLVGVGLIDGLFGIAGRAGFHRRQRH